ncbi:hypothetical protein J5J86_14070 [Aquabacter sp. L1I39]|uniref:hypothetical protein n=1 Tax=Aquabacter sp. L1I39 TaxID=2820278 RepID=UPI001ADA3F9F|nr:hypothetical protein [Aquabacter sp. L1I39]QTL01932.1 hypothetical protein J5J86_14070 [Aquabacter sp. L1I39]
MTRITHLLFDLDALLTSQGSAEAVAGGADDLLSGIGLELSFQVGPSAELEAAGLAFGNGIVGFAVGEDEDGSPAFLAIEGDGGVDAVAFDHGSSPCVSGAGKDGGGLVVTARLHHNSAISAAREGEAQGVAGPAFHCPQCGFVGMHDGLPLYSVEPVKPPRPPP